MSRDGALRWGVGEVASPPSNAVEVRRVAFETMPRLDPLTSQPAEIWFAGPGNRYLICILGSSSSGCGQITSVVSRSASGWSLDAGEITVC
jgi:hypothetical protein